MRFRYENLVVVTSSKELLRHTATQTEIGRTRLPVGATRRYNLLPETAYSASLLINTLVLWAGRLKTLLCKGLSHFWLISETLFILHFVQNTYILPVTFMDKLQLL